MVTIEPLDEWKARQVFEEVEAECEECAGKGECECCGRECLSCGGSGTAGMQALPDRDVEVRYFKDVIESLQRLCAFSSRHDFLDEVGAFIKRHGRLDYHPAIRQRILH
ncbi:hypothetical protein [Halomonas organivorans]|uniref:RecJ-like exonuclease n=1 Tax=Halomonas organivorans TaxID=257772 RepID=A0A7W5C108_9GAMM|nr:hypothetical protein [Halomonas organivorans]MBB3142784.1 RecJ-like exonuclease [Halomonas organivorans]